MDDSGYDNDFPDLASFDDESSVISTRGLEAFGRKVTSTASHLMTSRNDPAANPTYKTAMTEVHRQLRKPGLQRSIFSMARTTPTDMVRSRLSTKEIQSRALAYVPDELLQNIPDGEQTYSLFQGFQASFPDFTEEGKKHRRHVSRGRKLLDEGPTVPDGSPETVQKLKKEKAAMMHELEMLGIRKNMASSEIREIDAKIENLKGMRSILLERLANLEQDEALLEHDIVDVEGRLEEALEMAVDAESAALRTPTKSEDDAASEKGDAPGFMSQSVYEKLPSGASTPTKKKMRSIRRKSMPILHEHFQAGTMIRSMRAHHDNITALDFDAPFGLMVSAAMDDSVRVEDNLLATGSMDATIRLWDLSKAHYDPHAGRSGKEEDDEDAIAFGNPDDPPVDPPAGSMADCPLFTLQAHLDEITALHFRDNVLVSGSADKTLRQWDLEKGRCVQTLDVMWAAAQASALSTGGSTWRQTSRAADVSADFVGALQVFESALACGTADGMVRLSTTCTWSRAAWTGAYG
ncbi:hypothetical protein VTH06DRAFT_1607 [Thermothelomyces fergusii]